jgi:hypothetical protein
MTSDDKAGAKAPVPHRGEKRPISAVRRGADRVPGKRESGEAPPPARARSGAAKAADVAQAADRAPDAPRAAQRAASARSEKPAIASGAKKVPAAAMGPADLPAASAAGKAASVRAEAPKRVNKPAAAVAESVSGQTERSSASVAEGVPVRKPTPAIAPPPEHKQDRAPAQRADGPAGAVVSLPTASARPASASEPQGPATLRGKDSGSAAAGAQGLAEINDKLLALMRAQLESTYEIWRATVSATSPAEAVQAQADGMRRAFETIAARWRDLAEASARAAGGMTKPLQSDFRTGPRR